MAKKKLGLLGIQDQAEKKGKKAKMPTAHEGHFDKLKPLLKKSVKGVKTGRANKAGHSVGAHGPAVKAQAKAHKALPTKKKKKK